jgi:N-acetylneuraminic acid mutarotase
MKLSTLFCSLFFVAQITAQNYTWMRGSNQSGLAGVYGTQGVSSPTIDPGGRHGCGQWIDQNGDLWMFGGEGYSVSNNNSWLNDLWKYSVSANQWTWMGGSTFSNQPTVYGSLGVPAASNQPGAREFPQCWTDNTGKFWMFGGLGFGSNPAQTNVERLGDLWRYDPVTNLWTWIHGFNTTMQNGSYGNLNVANVANRPGCRIGAATWVDAAGDLWMFGGRGYPAAGNEGFLNDLWKYNIASAQWTWMGGTNLIGQAGVYGTQGVPSTGNLPGGKEFPAAWTDALGRAYIFGGRSSGYFNDLWRFDPLANTWTWLKGASTVNQAGNYGTVGQPATANVPGARFAQAHWTDKYGQLWLMGGQGRDSSALSGVGFLNDLWRYDICTNNWIWMKGAPVKNLSGIYGTQGVAAASNNPGGRFYINYWTGKEKTDLWIIGGEGQDAASTFVDHMNDVWKYTVPSPSDSAFSVSGTNLCSGNSATLTAAPGATSTLQWFSTATSTAVLFSGAPYVSNQLSAIGSASSYSFYAQIGCSALPRALVQIKVQPLPTIIVNSTGALCNSNFSLQASGASTYTWLSGSTSATAGFSTTATSYSTIVIGTSSLGCENSTSYSLSLLASPTLSVPLSSTLHCANEVVSLTASGANTYSWSNGQSGATSTLTASGASTTQITVTGTATNGCSSAKKIDLAFNACAGFADLTEIEVLYYIVPNPNTGSFKLQFVSGNTTALRIVSMNGQVLHSSNVDSFEVFVQLDLPAGLYFIEAFDAAGNKVVKPFTVTN